MSEQFLAQVDLNDYLTSSRGLDTKGLSYVGKVFVKLLPESIDDALAYLQQTFGRFRSYFDVAEFTSTKDVISLLDAGAEKVFITVSQFEQLKTVDNVDQSRFVVHTHGVNKEQLVESISGYQVGVFAQDLEDSETLDAYLKEYGRGRPSVFASFQKPTVEKALHIARLSAIPIVPATKLTADAKAQPELIPIAKLLLANVTSDRPDGLYTTLVTDERGIALGLVYSSEESVAESLRTGRGVYQSRKRGLWYKGDSSGDVQELIFAGADCDNDCLRFTVRQKGRGFCHLATATCFGPYQGLSKLQQTLVSRKASAPSGSYTARLFNDTKLLEAKIREEAGELCEAINPQEIAFEAADLLYFVLTKCIGSGVTLEDIERNLDAKSVKVKRRKGDAKEPSTSTVHNDGSINGAATESSQSRSTTEMIKEATSAPKSKDDPAGTKDGLIQMRRYVTSEVSPTEVQEALKRPSQRSTEKIMAIVNPIIKDVQERGDNALLEYTHRFEKATSLTSPVIRAPFPKELMRLPEEIIHAIDVSFENIRSFHAAQKEEKPLVVETMPGVVCSRFSRPIERVGLYVPGGTAVLPSTALMLGVPAMVAGCKKIVIASPPRSDGSITPEIVYVAHKIGAESIVLAGGAQAVAAMAYGTESVTKVDKILGPGNQFVTAGKMVVSNDTGAGVSIDMPAGPSEVLVVADATANPAFVASDLLSQAEHGVDSQVVLIAVDLSEQQLAAIEEELHKQANALPRVDIIRGAIEHSVTLVVKTVQEAMELSNLYAPEHLILQVKDAQRTAGLVENAGSVFIGEWTPESVGDYSAGVNHSLPTYGYAKQYSGVNLGSFIKHITSSNVTPQGLRNVGQAVMQLAKVEELEAHRRAVSIRLAHLDQNCT